RKQHAFDEVETARDAKLHRGTRNAADVALVIGVAMDDFELITAPYDAKRKHARSMNELAGHVDRQISDHLAARLRRLPFARRGERQVLEQRLRACDNIRQLRFAQRCCHCASLLPMKALRPSTASWVSISSSRYSRSTKSIFA